MFTGRRRLNVLFTREKEQIITFTSITPLEITAEETTNAGAWMLIAGWNTVRAQHWKQGPALTAP